LPGGDLAAEASELINTNAGGYPPRRSFNGGETMDAVERLAVARAKAIFGAEHANIQSLSATISNIAVLRALLRPGDRIMGFDMAAGGHNSHGDASRMSGMDYAVRSFGVDDAEAIDYDGAGRLAREFRPRMIIAGSSSYPWAIDFRRLAQIAAEVEALLVCDIAHVAGLVIAGLHDNPTPYSDVVTTSTHTNLLRPAHRRPDPVQAAIRRRDRRRGGAGSAGCARRPHHRGTRGAVRTGAQAELYSADAAGDR
jgi:glycine hydroxymethyltransferase